MHVRLRFCQYMFFGVYTFENVFAGYTFPMLPILHNTISDPISHLHILMLCGFCEGERIAQPLPSFLLPSTFPAGYSINFV